MKIVSASPERLEFEHKSWTTTILNLSIFLLLSVAMIAGGEKQVHVHVFGTLVVCLFAVFALFLAETSRVVFDRTSGTVRLFRKRAFRTTRLEIPFREVRGAIPEKVYYHKVWYRRISLVFSDGNETWLVPASLGATQRRLGGLAADINAWLGTSTQEAETVAGDLIRDARAVEIQLAESWIRRWSGRK